MNIVSGKQFANQLSDKLRLVEILKKKITHLAKEVIDKLRLLKQLKNDVNRLAYSKMTVHALLICHGFALDQGTTFSSVDDNILQLKYVSSYRSEFIYDIDFKPEERNVKISMTRNLDGVPQDMACSFIVEQPELTNDSESQDNFMTEKVLISLLKKFCKLWTNFKRASEPPTPPNPQDDTDIIIQADVESYLKNLQ